MVLLRDAMVETINELDMKNSAASLYLTEAYRNMLRYNLSDIVITTIIESLAAITEIEHEEEAEGIAYRICVLVRTVAS